MTDRPAPVIDWSTAGSPWDEIGPQFAAILQDPALEFVKKEPKQSPGRFKCPFCGREFRRHAGFRSHTRMHETEGSSS
jgi:hypothetical protein